MDAHREGDEVVATIRVPTNLVFFEGHFEGNPMLPAVAQILGLVDREARRWFRELFAGRAARRIGRLKFQATIRPGEDIVLRLGVETDAELRVRFRIDRNTPSGVETASTGTLVYSAVATDAGATLGRQPGSPTRDEA